MSPALTAEISVTSPRSSFTVSDPAKQSFFEDKSVAPPSLAESVSVGLAVVGRVVGVGVRGSEGGVFGGREGEPAA